MILQEAVYAVELIAIAVGLVTAFIYLAYNLQKYFAKQLKEEARRIQGVFITFSLSFASRAVVYILKDFEVLDHEHLVYYSLYFFWDIIPLPFVMKHHLDAFKAQN